MSWWNLGGLNPKYRDFIEKHPDATMIGMTWSLYWRLILIIFIVEIIFVAAFMIFAGGLSILTN